MTEDQNSILEMTLRQLRKVASRLGVSRYSRMRKEELLQAIQEAESSSPSPAPTPTVPVQSPAMASATPYTPEVTPSKGETLPSQERVEAAKYELGSKESIVELASVDEGLPELPDGYGESRIVLMPRDPQWAFVYWDVPNDHKEELRRQGGQQIALRLCDATDIDLNSQAPHNVQEYPCDELAREWYLPIPVSDRDYAIEIGYRCADGRWLMLSRSATVRIPPTYPSDWIEDIFMTVDWSKDLRGGKIATLVPPALRQGAAEGAEGYSVHKQIFDSVGDVEALRVAGSLFGSMQQEAVSSFIFPSGMAEWTIPTASGINMSGIGFSASAPPIRPRQFWLIADAELIVYGATEPDATVTIGDREIELSPDGTFRFQMSFQDGVIDYPIKAVASDGEQNREIHMTFTRETPARRTNTKAEAIEEWLI